MKRIIVRVLALTLVLLISAPVFSQETSINGLYHYELENGLDLFVMENSSAPLAYIEIAVKAGGIAQTADNSGYFHLYEHMMFKGNDLYPDAASVQKAISNMGVPSWNGSTSSEMVNYFFTVPVSKLAEGLEFWAHAVRNPLMDEQEFENEKKVVLSEIEGDLSNEGWILNLKIQKEMFPKYPYRLDAGGSPDDIRNATVQDIRDIQAAYYVPNNAALFVGGDVDHEEVYALTQKYYGDWEHSADPWETLPDQQLAEPFEGTRYVVMPYSQLSPQIAQVMVIQRGPDTETDIESTYPADVLLTLLGNPSGRFQETLMSDYNLGIPSPEYIGAQYGTSRQSGLQYFEAIMLSPEVMIAERAKMFASDIQDIIIPEIASDPEYFSEQDYADVKRHITDDQIIAEETAEGFVSNLRFWWIATSPEYYFSYADRLSECTPQDVQKYVSDYYLGKPALVMLVLNDQLVEAQRDELEQAGFEVVTADNAIWWRNN